MHPQDILETSGEMKHLKAEDKFIKRCPKRETKLITCGDTRTLTHQDWGNKGYPKGGLPQRKIHFFKKIFKHFLFHECWCFACMCICVRVSDIDSCELPYGCSELNPGRSCREASQRSYSEKTQAETCLCVRAPGPS